MFTLVQEFSIENLISQLPNKSFGFLGVGKQKPVRVMLPLDFWLNPLMVYFPHVTVSEILDFLDFLKISENFLDYICPLSPLT